ncbi:MAG: hypothetical protein M3Q87_00040 [Actinomycetota bacterium]|nr:hypothetical protein [Actinomycetota bacterium]
MSTSTVAIHYVSVDDQLSVWAVEQGGDEGARVMLDGFGGVELTLAEARVLVQQMTHNLAGLHAGLSETVHVIDNDWGTGQHSPAIRPSTLPRARCHD